MYARCTVNKREVVLSNTILCEGVCVSQARHLSALSPRERGCIIVHPSLTHYSFTYLHSDTHIHTHTEHIHEC